MFPGVNKHLEPRSWSDILILSLWCTYALVILFAYTTRLIAFMTSPVFEKPLETWDDLLESDLIITVGKDSATQIKYEVSLQSRKTLNVKIEYSTRIIV